MARRIEGKVFRLKYAIGRKVQPPLLIEAQDMDEADGFLLLYVGETEKEIRVLAATEIDLAEPVDAPA